MNSFRSYPELQAELQQNCENDNQIQSIKQKSITMKQITEFQQLQSNQVKINQISDSWRKITELELLIEMEKSIKQMLQKAWLDKFTEQELVNFELQRQMNLLKNENQKQKKEIQEITDEKSRVQEELDKEHRNFLSANDEVVNKNKQITQLNCKIRELTDEKQMMQEDLDKEHRNFLIATDEVVSKNKQITQLTKKIKDLEDTLENQLRAFRQKNNELSEKQLLYNDLKYENQQLQNQIAQLHETEKKLREFLNNKSKAGESEQQNKLKMLAYQEGLQNKIQVQQVQKNF